MSRRAEPDFVGIVLAAGSAARFGHRTPKQFHRLEGRSVLERSVRTIGERPAVAGVVVVLPPSELEPDPVPASVSGFDPARGRPDLWRAGEEHARRRLAAFARAVTDERYIGLVLDVIVDPTLRGTKLGRTLLDAVCSHPELAAVESLELVCQPELVPFYERWGFTTDVGGSRLMRRRSREPGGAGA